MRYDAEHKQRTRDRVLTEAAKLIRADGPHGVGVANVMAHAGLTHGGFYAHFESKDDLIAAAIDRMFNEVRTRFLDRTGGRPAAEALAAYVDFYLSPLHRDSKNMTCPLPLLAAELPRLGQATAARYATGLKSLTQALAGPIAALGLADAEMLASSLVAELIGGLGLARAMATVDRPHSDLMLARSRRAIKARLGLADADTHFTTTRRTP